MYSLLPSSTEEDERVELLAAELQQIAGQSSIRTPAAPVTASPLTHVGEAVLETEPIPESFDQDEEQDLLALLGLEDQEWIHGLAPPSAEEEEREEPVPVVEPQHGSGVSTGQSSALTSHSCTPAPVTPLDDAYSPATEFEGILEFEGGSYGVPIVPPAPVLIPSVSSKAPKRKPPRYPCAPSYMYQDQDREQPQHAGPAQNRLENNIFPSMTTGTPNPFAFGPCCTKSKSPISVPSRNTYVSLQLQLRYLHLVGHSLTQCCGTRHRL